MAEAVLDIPVEAILEERLGVQPSKIAALCEQFKIAELSLFSAVLRAEILKTRHLVYQQH